MRVLTVSTTDQGGGAEQVAWDLFTGLEARGHDSWMAVGQKHSSHPKVIEIHASPWFDYRPLANPGRQKAWEWLRRWRRYRGGEDFAHPYSRRLTQLLPEPPTVVIAHNLHGGYFDLRALPDISQEVPLLLVLHDYWLLTGHCAYPFDCGRWKIGCGECPYLETPPSISRDATRSNLRLKRSLYERTEFAACSPSHRLLEDLNESVLNEGTPSLHWIPNGVDLACFYPGNSTEIRSRLDLPSEIPLILITGRHLKNNPFKDYDCATETIRHLAAEGRSFGVVLLGEREQSLQQIDGIPVYTVPFTSNRDEVADYFRACDLLLHATRQEVAALVLSEALASGLPSVASSAGNAAELLGNGGIVVPIGDAPAHARAVAQLLDDPAWRHRMGEEGRQRAEARGDREQMVSAYEKLLLNLTGEDKSEAPLDSPGSPLE